MKPTSISENFIYLWSKDLRVLDAVRIDAGKDRSGGFLLDNPHVLAGVGGG